MAPTLATACAALPPEGAAAPAARQSRFRGPCLKGRVPTLAASRNALPPDWELRLRPGPSTGSGQAKAGSAALDCDEGARMLIWVKRG